MIKNIVENFHSIIKDDPHAAVNFREVFKNGLFGLALKEVSLINIGFV